MSKEAPRARSPRERDDRTFRCPYCHADLVADATDHVACEACLARHHTSCWDEARGCASCAHPGRLEKRPRSRGAWLAVLALAVVAAAGAVVTMRPTTPAPVAAAPRLELLLVDLARAVAVGDMREADRIVAVVEPRLAGGAAEDAFFEVVARLNESDLAWARAQEAHARTTDPATARRLQDAARRVRDQARARYERALARAERHARIETARLARGALARVEPAVPGAGLDVAVLLADLEATIDRGDMREADRIIAVLAPLVAGDRARLDALVARLDASDLAWVRVELAEADRLRAEQPAEARRRTEAARRVQDTVRARSPLAPGMDDPGGSR